MPSIGWRAFCPRAFRLAFSTALPPSDASFRSSISWLEQNELLERRVVHGVERDALLVLELGEVQSARGTVDPAAHEVSLSGLHLGLTQSDLIRALSGSPTRALS